MMKDLVIINDIYYDLIGLENMLWGLLVSGSVRPKDGFNHFTLATVGEDLLPHQRTVINRKVSQTDKTLTFFSDYRTQKILDIKANPKVSCNFYDDHRKIQITLSGTVQLHHDDDITKSCWINMSPHGRKLYMSIKPPGTPSDEYEIGFDLKYVKNPPNIEEVSPFYKNFLVGIINVLQAEFLFLKREGNIRAKFKYDHTDKIVVTWLIP